MKRCNKCLIVKAPELFSKNVANADQLQATCKQCCAEYNRRWRQNNPDRVKNNNSQWLAENGERKKRVNNAWARTWRLKYPEKDKHQKRLWAQTNPGKANANNAHRRTSKRRRTPRWLSKEDRVVIRQMYEYASELSWLSEGGLQVDHIGRFEVATFLACTCRGTFRYFPPRLTDQKVIDFRRTSLNL